MPYDLCYAQGAILNKQDNEAPSCSHFWTGRAISITYHKYVAVALSIQHAVRMRRIVIRGLFGFTLFVSIMT